MAPDSPLRLPWKTLALLGRYALPLALWYTAGEAIRYGLFYGGYRFGLHNPVIPIMVLSLEVMASLAITVIMLHSVRDGLPGVRRRDLDESLTSWVADDKEGLLSALNRALLPFMIFYLAWGWFSHDAKAFVQNAATRGGAKGGVYGQIDGMKIIIGLLNHIYVAIICTAIFFILKVIAERVLEPKLPRVGSITVAFCEVNWTLFGLFSVEVARQNAKDWIIGRVFWAELGRLTGPVFDWIGTLWPSFKEAILGGLVWLVIAGVVLGVDAEEETALGKGKVGRRLASVSGIDKPRTPREVLTRELRDKWLPAVYGFRMVFRAGLLSFAVFAALLAAVELLAPLTSRGIYYLLGPHDPAWWTPRLEIVDFAVGMVHQAVRVCLLAAAFDLVIDRVSGRTAEPAPEPRPWFQEAGRSTLPVPPH